MPILVSIAILALAGALLSGRKPPRPPTDCPDCRPAIRSALLACAEVF